MVGERGEGETVREASSRLGMHGAPSPSSRDFITFFKPKRKTTERKLIIKESLVKSEEWGPLPPLQEILLSP